MSVRRAGVAASVVALLTAALVARPPVVDAQTGSGSGRPNVLIVITDDQRIESMGPMRRTRAWFRQGGT